MKVRFNIKKKENNKNFLFLTPSMGMIIILVLIISKQLPKFQEDYYKTYKNIDINVSDWSIQRENPSIKIIIDSIEILAFDSISKIGYEDGLTLLKKGKHFIEISTLDGNYKLIDTIEVNKFPMDYVLWVRYRYNPPIDTYKEIIINSLYHRKIKVNDLTDSQKADILKLIAKKIDKEFENVTNYMPSERHFTILLEEKRNIIIE